MSAVEEEQKFITIIEETPDDLRSIDMNRLLEARKMDADLLKYYMSKTNPKLTTPAVTTDAIAIEICRDDQAQEQRLINYVRIIYLGIEPSLIFKPDFLFDLYPFFSVSEHEKGVQVSFTIMPEALRPIPWTSRLVLKAILAAYVHATSQNADLEAAIKLLEIVEKAVGVNPDAHSETLSCLTPTLSGQELLYTAALLQNKICTMLERDTDASNTRVIQGIEKTGLAMIKAQPKLPGGYLNAGLARWEQEDAAGACEHWSSGLKVADEIDHRYYSCILRYELAWGIISGGQGETFIFETIHTLREEARALVKQLKYYKIKEKSQLIEIQQVVEAAIETAVPPGTELSSTLKAAKVTK